VNAAEGARVSVCYYHKDRPGVGVCMGCRVVICAACCTRLDGVNHCHACLKALGARREERRTETGLWPVAAAAVGTAGWLVLFLFAWLAQGWLAP
jgi:hypothetical protein